MALTRHALFFGPRFAGLRVALGAGIISLSGVFVKLVSVSPTVSGVYRVFFGGLMLAAWVLWQGQRLLPRMRVIAVLAIAALFFALDLAFWHRSILLVGPGMATLLGNFQVFFMALGGAFLLREKLTPRNLLAIPLALFGLALIVGFDWNGLTQDVQLGVIFGLLTAVAYAAYMLTMRAAQGDGEKRTASADLAVVSLLCAAMLALSALIEGESLALPNVADAAWLLLYALVAQVIGWVLITSSLTSLSAARVGLTILLQPVLAFVWDIVIFARAFTPLEATGAVIALVAIFLGTRAGAGNRDTSS